MTGDDLLAGRYRTLRLIGTGGMARVFLAEDQRLGRQVAVKRLHAHSPEDIARRFQREARLGAALNHPNLVAVYDVETDGESVLIVMEYVEGTTLAAELKAGALGVDRTVAIISDVAAALDAVHEKGIVHRDVKPANVLIRADGTAKLADLGIASAAEGTSITASGAVLGTAAYMAPEQVRGEGVGPQADIYALAALAYEALSGERAHQGDTPVQIAHSITDNPARDVRDSWPGAPAAVAAALMRGMALRPEDRPRHAGDLAAELRAAAAGAPDPPTEALAPTAATRAEPAPAPTPRPAPATTHRSRSFPLAAITALALAVAAVALGFVLLSGGDEGGGDPTASETTASRPQATETSEEPSTAPAPEPTTPAPEPEPETTPEPTTPAGRIRSGGRLAPERPRLRAAEGRQSGRRRARAPAGGRRLPGRLHGGHPRLRPVQPCAGAAPDRPGAGGDTAAGETAVVLGQPAQDRREGAEGGAKGRGRLVRGRLAALQPLHQLVQLELLEALADGLQLGGAVVHQLAALADQVQGLAQSGLARVQALDDLLDPGRGGLVAAWGLFVVHSSSILARTRSSRKRTDTCPAARAAAAVVTSSSPAVTRA